MLSPYSVLLAIKDPGNMENGKNSSMDETLPLSSHLFQDPVLAHLCFNV